MAAQTTPSLEQQLLNMEKNLATTSARLARSAMMTRVIGLLLLCLITGYFVYGFNEVKTLVDPNYLVPMAGGMLDDSIPELQKSLSETVATSAPLWAEDLSTAAIQSAPQAREGLEEYILSQTAQALDVAAGVGEQQLRNVIKENRAELEVAINKLSENEQYSEETLQIFTEALDQELGRDMKDEAHVVLGTLIGLKEKLSHLSKGKSLSREDSLARDTLMTIRYLQLREADEGFEQRLKKRGELDAAATKGAAEASKAAPPSETKPSDSATPDSTKPAVEPEPSAKPKADGDAAPESK